mmetsp:Transcript_31424/g.56942  ORF Transcript_31424/g.56942 Transcript_31424/m.56942 type:complete len:426 (+) Transcript_31424:87-1364(+)
MTQDDLFLSLNQILQDHFHEFPRAELLNEPVDTVRRALWNLVQNSDLSTVQFVAVWCEYAHAKEVDLNHGEYYFGLDRNVFLTLSKKDLISVSLKALKNCLEQHLEFINLWKESCHQINEQGGNEQETEKDTGDEPRESEDEVASVLTRPSSRNTGRKREIPTLAPGQAVARRSLTRKKKHSSRKRPLPKSQDEDQSSPRKRGRPGKYPPQESAAKMPKSLSPRKRCRPRKNSMSKSSTTKPKDKDHDAATAIAVTRSAKNHAPDTARLQVSSDDDSPSSRSSKRLIKPRNRFDPCNGNGRLWSEAGQPIRKIPEHALMKKSTGRKRSNRIFDIAERATKKGVFTPKSLWKYICPNDNKSYIVEIVKNVKGVRGSTAEVAYRGYGSKCRVAVESLQVPTDKDFDTFEANFLYARQVAKESRSRRH